MSDADLSVDKPLDAEGVESSHASLSRVLRWWPAAVILAAMAIVKAAPSLFESPPISLLMVAFMGPPAISLLLLLWWLFASRASIPEKLIGFVGLIAIAIGSIVFSHYSMQGMSTVIFQVPVGLVAFALPLVLLARVPGARVVAALASALIGFGYFDLLKLYGTTGRFQPEYGWRWEPSPEDDYLNSLAGTSGSDAMNAVLNESISRESAEWPDFRGRNRDGVVSGVVLETDWDTGPPQLVWKSRIGPGWSSFSVAGDRLFTQEQRGEEEAVVCLAADTGRTVWSKTYPGRFWEAIGGAGPRATPTIGNQQLFTLGADGQLFALDPANGDVQWQRSLREDAQRGPPIWGWSASPLFVDPLVIVHAGGKGDKGVLAYDASTGEKVWGAASGDHSYSSPQLASFFNVEGILMMTNAGLQFLDVQDGTTIWEHSWPIENYRAIQPLVVGNSIFIGASMGAGTRKISIDRSDDQWTVTEDWTSQEMKPEFNDYVAYEGNLYGFDGNILACMDLQSGERKWKRGRYGNGQLLLLSDSGQLLITSEKGEIVVVAANPDRFIEIAKLPAIEGKTWNHPVLVGNRFYLRNGQEVACFELKTAAALDTPSAAGL